MLIVLLLSSGSLAESRIALLIGNQAYNEKVGPLKNPHNDIAVIGTALEKLGFNVTRIKDAGYRAIDTALKRHIQQVRRAGKDTISFVYYSGHGAADPDTQINYLIPVDVGDADNAEIWTNSIDLREIVNRLREQSPDAVHYVIFDACREEVPAANPIVITFDKRRKQHREALAIPTWQRISTLCMGPLIFSRPTASLLKGQGGSVSPPHGEHPELRCTKVSGTDVSHSLGIRWLAPVRTRTRRWAFAVRETRAAASQITLPKEPDGRYRASVTSVFLRTTGTYRISNSSACVPRSVLVGVRRTWRPKIPAIRAGQKPETITPGGAYSHPGR